MVYRVTDFMRPMGVLPTTKSMIADLVAVSYYGSYAFDAPILTMLTDYFMDARNTTADRLLALRRIDEIMGITDIVPYDEHLLSQTVAAQIELLGDEAEERYPHHKARHLRLI